MCQQFEQKTMGTKWTLAICGMLRSKYVYRMLKASHSGPKAPAQLLCKTLNERARERKWTEKKIPIFWSVSCCETKYRTRSTYCDCCMMAFFYFISSFFCSLLLRFLATWNTRWNCTHSACVMCIHNIYWGSLARQFFSHGEIGTVGNSLEIWQFLWVSFFLSAFFSLCSVRSGASDIRFQSAGR